MTQAIVSATRKIRRALQGPLHVQALAAGVLIEPGKPAIQWKGIPFDRDVLVTGATTKPYISVEIGFGAVIIHEVGPTPMVEGTGYITMVFHSDITLGEDGNDKLLGIATAAYPYASTPSFDGLAVHIDKMQHRGYGSDGPWLTGLVSVDWNIYRRS